MRPRNTSADPAELHLAGMIADGQPEYIETMEARGQRELVTSELLPTDAVDGDDAYLALGFTLGPPDDADPLFRPASLPDRWRRAGTPHAMWSHILDERGVPRVAVFYKAAFYDRRAFMRLVDVGSHYASEFIYGDGPDTTPWAVLTDDEREAFRARLHSYLADAAQHPDIYGDRAPRVRERLDALEAASR